MKSDDFQLERKHCDFDYTLTMRIKYSARLYRLLKQHKTGKEFSINPDDLKNDLHATQYDNYYDFLALRFISRDQ